VFYFLYFFFGASIGSFVQVIATRLHVAPVVKARSKCLSCGEALRAYDLIPIFSYLFLKGKCRHCKTKYGISTLIIEVFYGLLYVLLYHFILSKQDTLTVSSIWFIYYSLFFITIGVIALYDYAHTYIPITYLLSYCVFTFIMLMIRFNAEPTSINLLAPVIVALPFLFIWLITRGKGVGFGDVLLFLGVGAFFGVEQGLADLLLAIWTGAIIGGIVYLFRRKKAKVNVKINTAIPFVPFIILAFIFVLFTDIDIFSIAHIFS
jgi:leader peptidase (prepilin peptidase)/N-methyltransferase